jgi:hypothetical protein
MKKGKGIRSVRTRISDMTGRKADVPAEDTKMVAVAVIPAMNVGYAMTW